MSQIQRYDLTTALQDIETITGNAGGAVGPDGAGNVGFTGTNPITVTGTPGTNSLDITVLSATTAQIGVLELSTDAESIAGAATTVAVVPSSLAAKLGTQTANGVAYGAGTTAALNWTAVGTNGQILIGATAAAPAFSTLTSADGSIAFATGANTLDLTAGGAIASSFPTDAGTATPAAGVLTVTGGTNIATAGAGSTVTVNFDGILPVTSGGTGVATLTDGGILLGSGAAAVTVTANPTDGQLLIGSTAVDPVLATLASADATVTITNGSGTIDLSAAGGALVWSVETDAAVAGAINRGYIANRASLITITLPTTAAIGSIIEVTGINVAVGWRIAQNASEIIHFGTSSTTTGVGGYIEATEIRDSVRIVCVVADTEWNVLSSLGNITIV